MINFPGFYTCAPKTNNGGKTNKTIPSDWHKYETNTECPLIPENLPHIITGSKKDGFTVYTPFKQTKNNKFFECIQAKISETIWAKVKDGFLRNKKIYVTFKEPLTTDEWHSIGYHPIIKTPTADNAVCITNNPEGVFFRGMKYVEDLETHGLIAKDVKYADIKDYTLFSETVFVADKELAAKVKPILKHVSNNTTLFPGASTYGSIDIPNNLVKHFTQTTILAGSFRFDKNNSKFKGLTEDILGNGLYLTSNIKKQG